MAPGRAGALWAGELHLVSFFPLQECRHHPQIAGAWGSDPMRHLHASVT